MDPPGDHSRKRRREADGDAEAKAEETMRQLIGSTLLSRRRAELDRRNASSLSQFSTMTETTERAFLGGQSLSLRGSASRPLSASSSMTNNDLFPNASALARSQPLSDQIFSTGQGLLNRNTLDRSTALLSAFPGQNLSARPSANSSLSLSQSFLGSSLLQGTGNNATRALESSLRFTEAQLEIQNRLNRASLERYMAEQALQRAMADSSRVPSQASFPSLDLFARQRHLPSLASSASLNSAPWSQMAAAQARGLTGSVSMGGLEFATRANPALQSQQSGVSVTGATRSEKVRDPVKLFIPCDDDSLTPYQCLARKQIEFFEASIKEVGRFGNQTRSRAIRLGQVGIRCCHCGRLPIEERTKGSVYYPTKLEGVYQAAQNMINGHLAQHCQKIPEETRENLKKLSNKKSSAGGGKDYWAGGAKILGVVEDGHGLRFAPGRPDLQR